MSSVDFAAAQKRIIARRLARKVAAKAKRDARWQHDPSGPAQRIPAPLRETWHSIRPLWETISGREGTNPAFRVGQVDSELLDEELIELLKGQAGEALKYFGSHLRDDWSAEILFALRALLFKFTIWDHDASYGASLQNLKYMDARHVGSSTSPPTRLQKSLYGLISVAGRYAWTKWEGFLLDIEGGYEGPSERLQYVSSLSSALTTAHSVAAFSSFLVFLFNGRYRTILDRILRLRLVSTTAQVSREVSFEYLNRQLVWHAFTEFLLFLLPLVGISRWRRWIARAWRRLRLSFRSGGVQDDEDIRTGGELGFLPERTCAICYKDQNIITGADGERGVSLGVNTAIAGSSQSDITNPYEAISCGCKYCFVCLAQKLESEEGEGWVCLRCGETVRKCKPWQGDVIEDGGRNSSGKRVSFAEGDQASATEFNSLEPRPEQDFADREAQLETEIDAEVEQQTSPLLADSAEWAKLSASAALDFNSDEAYEDYDNDEDDQGFRAT